MQHGAEVAQKCTQSEPLRDWDGYSRHHGVLFGTMVGYVFGRK